MTNKPAQKGVFMRIAISTDSGFVSAHFGRCPSFTLVDIENGKAINKEEVSNPGHEPGAIPAFLHEKGVNYIVAGGMGMRAESFFQQYGIKTVVGVSGKVDDIIEQFRHGIVKGGDSLCSPGAGKGYGLDKQECDHPDEKDC
jgi:predicted Fe-Mo cluster-binding NifX family protein